MMKRKFIIAFILLIAFIGNVIGQERTITGTVTSAEDGTSLPGVNIIVKGTAIGTITDLDGNYSITVPADAEELEFSFVGMLTKTVTIGSANVIDVILEPGVQEVEEVVVTALGISKQKKALGYAVTEVSGENLSTVKGTNVINSLAGRVAGLVLTRNTSGPGGGTRVIIRGNNSVTGNNQPLYVVDGIPIDNSPLGGSSSEQNPGEYRNSDYGTGISDMNPDDIESISVLKGPNAAALYGSRASNGVILISTKKGTVRKGVGITFTSNSMFDSPMMLPKYQNKYGMGSGGNMPNTYADLETFKTNSGSWGGEMDGSDQLYWTDSKWDGIADTRSYTSQPDNVKDFFRTGSNLVNTITMEGGTQKASLRFSFTNNIANSIMPEAGLTRNNFNLRAFAKPADFFSIDAKVTYFVQDSKYRIFQGTEGIMAYLYTIPRNADIEDYKKYYQNPVDYSSNSAGTSGANPYFLLYNDVNDDNRNRTIGFVKTTFDITDYLSVFARVGTDAVTQTTEVIHAVGHHFWPGGTLDFTTRKVSETNADFLVMFNKEVASGIDISANFGGNMMQNTFTSQGVSGEDFKVPTKPTTSSARVVDPSYTPLREKRINSLYGSVSLAYNSSIYLDVSGRNDWSSTLPEDNWSYFYPSVSLSFLLSEMIDMGSLFDFVKVRGSWAQVGSDTDPYQLDIAYNLSSPAGSYLGLSTLSRPEIRLNPDLKPEQTGSIEFGLELRLLNSKLYFDGSYYDIKSTDLIMDVPVSPATGYSYFRSNVGQVTNTGFEFLVGGVPLQKGDFSWDVSVNFGKNKNTLDELTEDLETFTFSTTNSGILNVRATVGGGYGDIYGTVWQETDDGRKVTDASGRPQASTKKEILGNYQPDWVGGMVNTFKYNNLSLNLLIDARIGGQIYSGTDARLQSSGVGEITGNRESRIVDAVVNTSGDPDNPTWEPNTVEITGAEYHSALAGIAETHVYDQTNIRLREVSLMYTLPKSLFSNFFIEDITAGLVGRNLFFLYKEMDNFDPESSMSTSNFSQGVLWYNLPTVRSIGFNLNVRF